MDKILIEGGKRLKGEAEIGGSKNASLPMMSAALMAAKTSRIFNVPDLRDIRTMGKVLETLGAEVGRDKDGALVINAKKLSKHEAPYDLVKTMRASIYVMGPLLARLGKAKVSLPGGCAIGQRPIDMHLSGFEALGAKVKISHGYVEARAPKGLKGGRIVLDKPSVGATANIMTAAALATGTTYIHNAAQEPEIVDAAGFLNQMGAKITGAGTDSIEIKGVRSLKGCEYSVIPDRIEAGTLILAAAMTRGSVLLRRARLDHLGIVAEKLQAQGVQLAEENGGLRVMAGARPKPVNIYTMPHPGFPTDMQAQWMAFMATTKGTSVVTETIRENRFMHVPELVRMGADIKLEGSSAIITGVPKLSGAEVMASDLRASAALVLAGLSARGKTEVSRIYHLDRGYERLEEKLTALGAKVTRVPD